MVEDRRRATIRLTILQYTIIGIFTTLAVGFWVMQVVHDHTQEHGYIPHSG